MESGILYKFFQTFISLVVYSKHNSSDCAVRWSKVCVFMFLFAEKNHAVFKCMIIILFKHLLINKVFKVGSLENCNYKKQT